MTDERRLERPATGTGVLRTIKGDIGAIRAITAAVDFSSQGRRSKEGARSSLFAEKDLAFFGRRFTSTLLGFIQINRNSPAT
jgi:hypothetical protein